MINFFKELKDNCLVFLSSLEKLLQEHRLLTFTNSLVLDHICFRVSDVSSYVKYQNKFLNISKLLIESKVNGRLISTYKLNDPIIWESRVISVIELPEPKSVNNYNTGFEHAEFVTDLSFEKIIKKFPNLNFSKKGMHKEINPELKVQLSKEIAIKFHHQPLEEVIEFEKTQVN